jgi:two-component system cell cycle response regulator CtrA
MRAYVFEPREKRQAALASELSNAGIEPHFVDEDFFEAGLAPLTQPGPCDPDRGIPEHP